MQSPPPPPTSTVSRGNKRGSSATQRMLANHASQLDAEQETSGNPSIWREVYALIRCPGPPCNLGPHCWRDPFSKKHYKLRAHHLKALIEFVQQGHALKSHDDAAAAAILTALSDLLSIMSLIISCWDAARLGAIVESPICRIKEHRC